MKQKTKNLLLVIGFILVCAVAYQYTFSRTLAVRHQLKELQSQITKNSQRFQNRANLKLQEAHLDSIIDKNRIGNSSLQNNLLQTLNLFSNELSYKVINFKEPHIQILRDSTTITTFQFVLEGDYKDLEAMLYKLEREYSFGSLAHINFEKKKDYRKNRNYLQCMVLIKHVK